MAFGRRRFLLLGAGASGAAVLGVRSAVSAAADDVTPVWRLSAEWGYAVPPKNWTRCKCSACHSHAANHVYRTKPDSLADRIHPCCVCQPYSLDLLTADIDTLFPGSTTSIDLRHPDSRAAFEQAVFNVTVAATTTTTTTTTPTTTTTTDPPASTTGPSTTTPPAANAQPVGLATRVVTANGSPVPQQEASGTLPSTGSSSTPALAVAAMLVTGGAVALLAARPAGSPDTTVPLSGFG